MKQCKPHRVCFECGAVATFSHHVIPRSLGGTATVPLCGSCHARAHGEVVNWRVSELTKEALSHKRAKGEHTGGTVPFGFELVDGVRLIPQPGEYEVLKVMHSLRQQGNSLREIVELLNSRGVATKTGKSKWHPQVVKEVLDRTANLIDLKDG